MARYFFLPGSLTTPPCTQGVCWTLSAGHLSISSQDLAALQVCPPIHEITMHLRSSKCQWPPAIIGSARSAAFSRPSAVQSQLIFSDHFCVHSWSRAKIQELSSHSSSARFKRILSSFQATEIQLVYTYINKQFWPPHARNKDKQKLNPGAAGQYQE